MMPWPFLAAKLMPAPRRVGGQPGQIGPSDRPHRDGRRRPARSALSREEAACPASERRYPAIPIRASARPAACRQGAQQADHHRQQHRHRDHPALVQPDQEQEGKQDGQGPGSRQSGRRPAAPDRRCRSIRRNSPPAAPWRRSARLQRRARRRARRRRGVGLHRATCSPTTTSRSNAAAPSRRRDRAPESARSPRCRGAQTIRPRD